MFQNCRMNFSKSVVELPISLQTSRAFAIG
jgi:hypothetical protein